MGGLLPRKGFCVAGDLRFLPKVIIPGGLKVNFLVPGRCRVIWLNPNLGTLEGLNSGPQVFGPSF